MKYVTLCLLAALSAPLCLNGVEPSDYDLVNRTAEDVYKGFKEPPAEARPFVRWWWNNNQVEADELLRELEVLHQAGIGGIEINPIEKKGMGESKAPVLTWRSKEWDEMVHMTCKAARERGMIVDLIAGSGWPFGGEFLKHEETIMRVTVLDKAVKGPLTYRASKKELFGPKESESTKKHGPKFADPHLEFLMLLPKDMQSMDQVKNLAIPAGDEISIEVPAGEFVIAFGVKDTGFEPVVLGVKGAKGPVMDHMQRSITRAYLDRLNGMEKTWGEPLSTYVRAIFCDSIETSGANWTHDMVKIFQERKGYDITPYLPYVIKRSRIPTPSAVDSEVRRVRYDWNEHLVHLFLSNFTDEYTRFAHDHKLLSRYQAYGLPYFMGLAEGYMLPDIPEANNWIFSFQWEPEQDYKGPYVWSFRHGYMTWNKYAAAGGRLRGKRVVSSEAMTNTKQVFRNTLGHIKQADDMNFVTGITHSVLHGYNYNPPDIPFPGWIRFGSYFSENNTWWPYFKHWVMYNARLSHLFQSTAPTGDIALMGPTPDVWSVNGLERVAFYNSPAYLHKMWESLSQLGADCDYLHGAVIEGATVADGALKIGPMAYKVLILTEVESLKPETAAAIDRFAAGGGQVVFVKSTPNRSPGFKDAAEQDRLVADAIQASLKHGAHLVDPPQEGEDLRAWTQKTLTAIGYKWQAHIKSPRDGLYSLRHKALDEDVFFYTNTYRDESMVTRVDCELGNRGLWRWDPETGNRTPYNQAYDEHGFEIRLRPLESIVLVTGKKESVPLALNNVAATFEVNSPWQVTFQPAQTKDSFTLQMDRLQDFTTFDDEKIKNFSGTATYTCSIDLQDATYTHFELGNDQGLISEIWLNKKPVGVNWYGSQRFEIASLLKPGTNELTIKYTTTLFNKMRAAGEYKSNKPIQPTGLVGPVTLLRME